MSGGLAAWNDPSADVKKWVVFTKEYATLAPGCIHFLSCCCHKAPHTSLTEGRADFGSQFVDTIHRGRALMVMLYPQSGNRDVSDARLTFFLFSAGPQPST